MFLSFFTRDSVAAGTVLALYGVFAYSMDERIAKKA
jgi:hypothetical protein